MRDRSDARSLQTRVSTNFFYLSRYKKNENSSKLDRVFGVLALFDSISPIVSFLVPRSK